MLSTRRVRHHRVSATLAACDDDELAAMLQGASTSTVGVGGGSSVLDIDGISVFAKRIPITDRELAHPHSTANLFDLPTSCQYGMHRLAGPGFGAWRELAANTAVTEGVLRGESEAFALLHHWRVLPGRPPVASEHRDIEAVVAQFGGDPAVRSRFEELARASFSLVLFLEYLPDRLLDMLSDPVASAETVERQLFEAVAFLRGREVLHLDGHFGNMRADDDQIYLVDLGLATSPRFDLSDAERDFVARNVDHDADYAAMRLVNWLVTTVGGVPVPAEISGGPAARNAYVRRCASGDIPHDLPAAVADILARHAPAAAEMNDFCWRLFDGDIHAQYRGPTAGLRSLADSEHE
ncbi:serine/threonine protein phosphatase [Occultella gossypii]|nr:serine/threonine protein phosphatase [Occultella gossypii]